MNKAIRTKQDVIKLKTKSNKTNLSAITKEHIIKSKMSNNNDKEDTNPKSNANNQATEQFTSTAKYTTLGSAKKIEDIISRNASIKKINSFDDTNKINKSKHSRTNKHSPESKYRANIKILSFKKHLSKFEQSKNNINATKTIYERIMDAIKNSFIVVKKGATSINSMIAYGTLVILLIVTTLFVGVFASFNDNTVYGSSFISLSDEVLTYTDVITEYAEQYEMESYVPLIQAIMMVESKGLGNDPMDMNANDSMTSIEEGIIYLKSCIEAAGVTSVDDTELIYLAIQGYDFKIDYITWALDNFGSYSKSNVQLYYEQYLSNGDINYVNHVIQYIGFDFGTFRLEPDFDNHMAWGYNNPYSRSNLYGQCTWFAWGRFYELYRYDPGFTGDGWDCAKQLVESHPDKFELSSSPQIGSIYSCIGRNHVGIVVGWDGRNITIQEGNLDSQSNTFQEAKSDWH